MVEFQNSNLVTADVERRLELGCTSDCSTFTDAIRDELQQTNEGRSFSSVYVSRHELKGLNASPTPSQSPTRRRRSGSPSNPAPVPSPAPAPAPSTDEDSSTSGILVAVIVVVVILVCCSLAAAAGYFILKSKSDADAEKVTPISEPDTPIVQPVAVKVDVSPVKPAPGKAPAKGKIMIENEEGGEEERKTKNPKQDGKAGKAAAAPAAGKAKAKTFEETRYCELYAKTPIPSGFIEGYGLIYTFIEAIRERYNLPPKSVDDPVTRYNKKLEDQLKAKKLFEMPDIGAFLWTTADTLSDGSKERELCSYINEALREDEDPFVDQVLPLVRIINCLIVSARGGAGGPQKWPKENKTYRGIGMPIVHRKFFTIGKIYRVPMFLATSFNRATAEEFMRRMSGGELKHTMFIFNFDPVLRCAHANYVGHVSAVHGEGEFLMPPYSGFKIKGLQWTDAVSTVELQVYHDNKHEDLKNAPLAPWH